MLAGQEGKAVPSVTFHTRQGDRWVDVTTDALFKDKTVIVFSLPGAFTPTCSSTHLPRYNELAGQFTRLGVDSILCVSVNDTFVMNAWKAEQRADNITFPDLLVQLDIIAEDRQIRLPEKARAMRVLKGGPVETGRGFVLHSSDFFIDDSTLPIDKGVSLTTIQASIASWMLQPSTTMPGLSKTSGFSGTPAYSFSSNTLGREREYTWWRTVSKFGKLTAVPVVITVTRG